MEGNTYAVGKRKDDASPLLEMLECKSTHLWKARKQVLVKKLKAEVATVVLKMYCCVLRNEAVLMCGGGGGGVDSGIVACGRMRQCW